MRRLHPTRGCFGGSGRGGFGGRRARNRRGPGDEPQAALAAQATPDGTPLQAPETRPGHCRVFFRNQPFPFIYSPTSVGFADGAHGFEPRKYLFEKLFRQRFSINARFLTRTNVSEEGPHGDSVVSRRSSFACPASRARS